MFVRVISGWGSQQHQSFTPQNDRTLAGVIERVIDGDTVENRLDNGSIDKVRLLGVDTPEIFGSNQPAKYEGVSDTVCLEKWGRVATQFAKEQLLGQKVTLVFDHAVGDRDSFERLLAYVHVGEIDFNAALVKLGYARVYTEGMAYRKQQYLRLQRDAQREQAGLWGCERSNPIYNEGSVNVDCDSSYPDVCIPAYPPDLDCRDIRYRRFLVIPPDRHSFDGDADGIGCE